MAYQSLEISELIKKRHIAQKQYDKLKKQYHQLDISLNTQMAELRHLNTDYAVILRKIQEVKNDCFILARKKSHLENAELLLLNDIEKKEMELNQFIEKRDQLENQAKLFKNRITDIEAMKKIQQKICQESNDRIKEIINEKNMLSDEISNQLSHISTEKETIEAQLNQLNIQFMSCISERNNVSQNHSNIQSTFQTLSKTNEDVTSELKKCEKASQYYQENNMLRNTNNQLKQHYHDQETTWQSLKNNYHDKQMILETLTHENILKTQTIAQLENKVREFDAIVESHEQANQFSQEEKETFDNNMNQLKTIMTEITDMNNLLLNYSDEAIFNDTFGKLFFL